jgi:hypothetical protein
MAIARSRRVCAVSWLFVAKARSSAGTGSLRVILTQLSHRCASDTRNTAEYCEVPRPLSICGAKNCCPFRGRLVLTGSKFMCWRRCSTDAVGTVGRRKSRLGHRFLLGVPQTALRPPWLVWCLNRSAPQHALISSHIFSSGGKVGFDGCAHPIPYAANRRLGWGEPYFAQLGNRGRVAFRVGWSYQLILIS